jgi:hypothetical protein
MTLGISQEHKSLNEGLIGLLVSPELQSLSMWQDVIMAKLEATLRHLPRLTEENSGFIEH